jgi:hypothetical protein
MGILGAIVGVGVIVGWTASSIVVRTGMTVFDVAIPPGAKARAQLMSLARTLVKRQPG